MLTPVQCRECGKITAYIERASDIFPKSPAVTQAKGTTWEIVATCPKCNKPHPYQGQSNPFGDNDILNFFKGFGV